MVKKTSQTLIEHWRACGPIEWAEGAYGWIGVDGAADHLGAVAAGGAHGVVGACRYRHDLGASQHQENRQNIL